MPAAPPLFTEVLEPKQDLNIPQPLPVMEGKQNNLII
jgi:hypothetical protein